MSDYGPDGLVEIASLWADLSYEFDAVIVWKAEDGKVYWAADSGCSCPTPFEGYTRLEDLHRLPDTMHELKEAVSRVAGRDTDEQEFWKIVRRALRKK